MTQPCESSSMETLEVRLSKRSYPIYIGERLLENDILLNREISARQVLIITNEVVAPLYLELLTKALGKRDQHSLILSDGEQHKTLSCFSSIIDKLIDHEFHRDSCVVALGGGVIGDIAGFAAACYQRGIDYVQIPTTLLAQVDSSVGGKTAINHAHLKNMVGAFHQPISVFTDISVLKTLIPRQYSAGIAEIIKYGLVLDESFLEWLEEHLEALLALDAQTLAFAIRRSCELKAAIVSEDERDLGQRALLNFGHTFGHALESLGQLDQWLHGEAVSIGMSIAARTSCALGFISDADCERVDSLLLRANLPVAFQDLDPDKLLEFMQLDKKAGTEGLKLILLKQIGEGIITAAPNDSILKSVIGAKAII